MKAEILKIAGVKNEKEFYKMFPDEQSFMAKHGGAFRKAKRGDVIHKMQDGDAPCVGKNCRGKSWSPLADISVGGGSGGKPVKAIPEWNDISDIKNLGLDKKSAKALEKEYESIKGNYSGLTFPQYVAATRDADRTNRVFKYQTQIDEKTGKPDDRYSKYFNPETGALLPDADPRNVDNFMRFYRGKFPTQSKISAQDILGVYGGMPGGVSNYEKYANFGYNPELRQGGLIQAQDGIGSYTGGEQVYNPQPLNFQDAFDAYDVQMTGSTNAQRQAQAQAQAKAQQAAQKPASGGGMGGMDMSKIMGMLGGGSGAGAADLAGGADVGQLASAAGGMAKKGKKVPKYQNSGAGLNSPAGGTATGIQAAGTNPYAQGQGQGCPVGFIYDQYSTECVPDPNYSPVGSITNKSSSLPDGPGEYEEVQKFNTNSILSTGTPKTGPGTGNNPSADVPKKDPLDAIAKTKYAGLVGKVYGGIKKLKAEKEARKSAEQQASVSDLSLKASLSKPEEQRRTYNRPEDALVQPDQVFPSYGVGTNVLTAKDGMQIGGNQTEIQNMYNPGDLYQDLGYEPLSDSEIVKQYRAGGLIRRMQGGGGMPMPSWETVGNAGQMIGQGATGNNAGGELGADIGGASGEAIGMAVGGPAGKAIGKAIGQTVGAIGGGLLDRNPQKMEKAQNRTKRNVQTAAANSMGQALHSQFSANVRNGGDIPYAEDGWVSNDWLPQVITQFGEHSMKDLLRPDPMMDTLRTGGNISQNNIYPQDRYALGGELKTTWGGHAETMSHNPYLPGTGETVMFRGKSHEESDGRGHTGIGVKYGEGGHDSYTDYAEYGSENVDADVEVERGEPATEMIDGQTGEKNMVVFGNLKIPNQFLDQIGDPKAKGKKFKHYIAGVSKDEARQNKIIDKTSKQLDELDVYTPFDKLKLEGLNATNMGANMKLQKFAEIKKNASAVQDAINETAKEHGVDADALAKGKVKIDKQAQKEMAKYGKEILKGQTGLKYKVRGAGSIDYNDIGAAGNDELWGNKTNYEKNWKPKVDEALSDPKRADAIIQSLESYTGQDAKDVVAAIKKQKTRAGKIAKIQELGIDEKVGPYHNLLNQTIDKTAAPKHKMTVIPSIPEDYPDTTSPTTTLAVQPLKQDPWMTALNQLAPYLRPSDVDYNVDLYPEMMAAGMNQVEPVFAQGYQPQLLTPYDISYQDQLNEITAQARAAERMAGQNPAAAATLLATASGEKNKVLGEQFRQNQAQRMGVYNQNIATLNDAQLKNLGIYADQAAKQSQARSNTKAQAMEIEKSMSDKIAKNKLENKTLQTYENLYNYRFGKDGRAQNYNPLAQFDISADGKVSAQAAPEGYEYETILKKKKKEETARNGSIVRALKNF
jgi:hypothetical protein